jgi:hypothetical protein
MRMIGKRALRILNESHTTTIKRMIVRIVLLSIFIPEPSTMLFQGHGGLIGCVFVVKRSVSLTGLSVGVDKPTAVG